MAQVSPKVRGWVYNGQLPAFKREDTFTDVATSRMVENEEIETESRPQPVRPAPATAITIPDKEPSVLDQLSSGPLAASNRMSELLKK